MTERAIKKIIECSVGINELIITVIIRYMTIMTCDNNNYVHTYVIKRRKTVGKWNIWKKKVNKKR